MAKKLTRLIDILNWITAHFEDAGIESPRRNAEWLIEDILQLPRLDLYLQFDRPLSIEERNALRKSVLRRTKGEPLQHILGYTEFYGLKFLVSPDVLIPRPETEIMVEKILEHHPSPKTILDIGTGTGCIAIALKKNIPTCEITAIDSERSVLSIAKKNAENNEIEIIWDCQNIFRWEPTQKYNIIVSNPPYIAHEDAQHLPTEIRKHEPEPALFADKEGLQYYPRLAEIAMEYLDNQGSIWVEIGGKHQVEPVQKFFQHAGLKKIQIFDDLSNTPRVIKAKKE